MSCSLPRRTGLSRQIEVYTASTDQLNMAVTVKKASCASFVADNGLGQEFVPSSCTGYACPFATTYFTFSLVCSRLRAFAVSFRTASKLSLVRFLAVIFGPVLLRRIGVCDAAASLLPQKDRTSNFYSPALCRVHYFRWLDDC